MSVGQEEFEAAISALYDNSSWESERSLTKARLYITAAKQLMLWPEEGTHGGLGGESFRWPKKHVVDEMKRAADFVETCGGAITAGGPTGSVTYSRYWRT